MGSDAEKIRYVYDWRLEQEVELRATQGDGMADEQVHKFVDGCKSNVSVVPETTLIDSRLSLL